MKASLEALRVSTPAQVETLRQIRNATAAGFSHDNTQISHAVQRAWWSAMRGRVHAWLYAYQGEVVGFGLVRQTEDGRWWNSLGVLPAYQGQGFGSAITTDLLSQHDGPVYASVRCDNLPAIAMHHPDQWERYDSGNTYDDPLVYFRSVP